MAEVRSFFCWGCDLLELFVESVDASSMRDYWRTFCQFLSFKSGPSNGHMMLLMPASYYPGWRTNPVYLKR